uniref:Uncharacterized protein n=1 Tax=Tanacetum cinerariifolium TaxID=118510 RepID=A0A699I630_TANCI|nr:hypothetical protein [Tanacetum cinerariifolium]
MSLTFSFGWRNVTSCSQIMLTGRIQKEIKLESIFEYLRHGSKGSSPALLISKMKVASYPNFCLELLVPKKIWIEDVCTYDISAKYDISHWWFNGQKFYIDRHESPWHRKEVRSNMRILSVIIIKAYSRYGDFEDLNLLLLQGKDFQLGIESYQTSLNLAKLGWDVAGYEFKYDYTIIESPRAVVFSINNNERKIMWFNEIYKLSDDTLIQILEALSYRVKEFKIKRLNPAFATLMLAIMIQKSGACRSEGHNITWKQYFTTKMIKTFTVADDLKESLKITQEKGTMLKDHYLSYKVNN